MVILPPSKKVFQYFKQQQTLESKKKKKFLRFFSFEIWTGCRQEKVRAAAAETAGEEKMSGLLFIVFMILLRPNKMCQFQI